MKLSMRMRFLTAAAIVFLSACSGAEATPEPVSPTPFITKTPVDTPTPADTPLPTPSATIVKIPTQDFDQPTYTPFVLIIGGNTVTPYATSLPGPGFVSVTYLTKKIYWGGCDPNSVVITAEVEDLDEVFSVLIFTRVKDYTEEDYTPWTSGAVMLNRGQGEFTYNLIGGKVFGHNHYLRSWVYFQLVATNIKGEEIGRTRIYEKAIEMYPCPCLTPLKGCPATPIPTRTPQK